MVNLVDKDAIIVGAGPSGSQLAFALAKLGRRVLVLERKAAAGEGVCCTGIVSRQCVDDYELDESLALRHASSARFVLPSGKQLRLWRDDEVACILDRSALDRALARRAQEAGADYLFNNQVMEVLPRADCVQVKALFQGEEVGFSARAVVLATGFGSPLPGRLGLGHISRSIIGAQAKVSLKEVDEIEVYFDRGLAQGGFAWLVPTADGQGLAGLLAIHHPELHLERLLSHLEAQGKIASTEAEAGFAAIPLRPLPRTSTDRILALGEAAGQVKPTTGGGIYYGLLCADIAAGCLEPAFIANDLSKARLSSYDRQWRAQLNRELRNGYWLCRLYQRLSNQQIERLFQIMADSGLPQFIAGLDDLHFDRHGTLAFTLLKHLATSAPLQTARALLVAIRA